MWSGFLRPFLFLCLTFIFSDFDNSFTLIFSIYILPYLKNLILLCVCESSMIYIKLVYSCKKPKRDLRKTRTRFGLNLCLFCSGIALTRNPPHRTPLKMSKFYFDLNAQIGANRSFTRHFAECPLAPDSFSLWQF